MSTRSPNIYKEDELAADSGDEKRLQRAEQRAGRKQKSSKEVRKKGRFSRKPFKALWSHPNAELTPMQQSLGSAEFDVSVTRA